MSKLVKVQDIISGRSATSRTSRKSPDKSLNIVRLLSKQHEVLTSHNAGSISGKHKVDQLIKYGFVIETVNGVLESTEKAVAFLNNEVAYPMEAILEAQAIVKQEFYCSSELKEALGALGVSEDYLKWWHFLSQHSKAPGNVQLNKPHLEIFITGCSEEKCLKTLGSVKGYFFGKSRRSTTIDQFTLIIVGAS